MITQAGFWKGRDVAYAAELTPKIKANAAEVQRRVNVLLVKAGLTDRDATSGWRPSVINSSVGGAKLSPHKDGNAIDVADGDRKLQNWCLANLHELEAIGLYMEHPRDTPTWCHLQSVPPKSGKRVFYAK